MPKTQLLLDEAVNVEQYARTTLSSGVADFIHKLAAELERFRDHEEARLRDLQDPDETPESVTDAAFESQADWYTPGAGKELSTVIVSQFIESVADAAYKATREHLAGGERS